MPLFGYEVPVLTDESVDPEYGTGLMMVCTFGDGEDVLGGGETGSRCALSSSRTGGWGSWQIAGLGLTQARSAITKARYVG